MPKKIKADSVIQEITVLPPEKIEEILPCGHTEAQHQEMRLAGTLVKLPPEIDLIDALGAVGIGVIIIE